MQDAARAQRRAPRDGAPAPEPRPAGAQDETLKLWDASTGAETHTLRGHGLGVNSCAFSRDGSKVVSGSHVRAQRAASARLARGRRRAARVHKQHPHPADRGAVAGVSAA